MELAEEHLWTFICIWQDVMPDVEVFYADSFDIRDYPNELAFLQQARASGVQSATFTKGIDKMIADLVLDDEELNKAYEEIDSARSLGDFSQVANGG